MSVVLILTLVHVIIFALPPSPKQHIQYTTPFSLALSSLSRTLLFSPSPSLTHTHSRSSDRNHQVRSEGCEFTGSWMTMAHSMNLCNGSAFSSEGWPYEGRGPLRSKIRLGVIVDTRHNRRRKGADIYFAVNGVCLPIAFENVKSPLCFCVVAAIDEKCKVAILPGAKRPPLHCSE